MAINYDNSTTSRVAGGSATVTLSHTITGSNTVLFVGIENQNNGGFSTLTYGGVSFAGNLLANGSNSATSNGYLYYIYAAAGTANIVVTRNTTTAGLYVFGASYTGVNQSMSWTGGSPTDATTSGNGSGASSFTGTLTTLSDNSWTILVCEGDNAALSAGTGSTVRKNQQPGYVAWGLADSNGVKTPAGSTSMTMNFGGGSGYNYAMASFSPAVASTSQIKSADGVLIASIKSINGVAIANVKSVSGVTN